jgi:hypothetical protein
MSPKSILKKPALTEPTATALVPNAEGEPGKPDAEVDLSFLANIKDRRAAYGRMEYALKGSPNTKILVDT